MALTRIFAVRRPAGVQLRQLPKLKDLFDSRRPLYLPEVPRRENGWVIATEPNAIGASSRLPNLRRARDLADRHYAEPLDLDALAAAAHASKFHFNRCFRAAYGETPMRYLTRRRIERAQDLLRSANLTVTEVCMLVGFSSLGSFSSRFHELVGESPTRYRDRWASTGGPRIPGCYLFMRGIDRSSTSG